MSEPQRDDTETQSNLERETDDAANGEIDTQGTNQPIGFQTNQPGPGHGEG